MEKADSMATVTIKEFPDNVSYTTEAPPAYKQPRATAVQVARIAAITLIVSSTILGGCILASAWIQSSTTCELMLMEQQLQMAQQQMHDNPSFQALKQEEPRDNSAEESRTTTEKVAADEQDVPIRLNKVPLQLDFDELAGSIMDRNQRAHMNCVIEKRRSEELVDHAPREVSLPFGLNLTTPPRLEHLTGEKMVISCESGRAQERHMPPPPPPPRVASVPVMIPLPGGPIHLPLHPMAHQHHSNDLGDSHPMEHIEMIVAHPMMEQHHNQQEHPQMREMRMMLQEEPIPQESMRPHYVQPRSVPSQPDFLARNRKKRCACDCNC